MLETVVSNTGNTPASWVSILDMGHMGSISFCVARAWRPTLATAPQVTPGQ